MKVISRSREANAVQWDGSEDALRAIQQLIFPLSPYLPPNMTALGVPVSSGSDTFVTHALLHVDKGGWVSKDASGGIAVWTNAQFEQAFSSPELLARTVPLDLDRLAEYSANAEASELNKQTSVLPAALPAALPAPSWETDARSGQAGQASQAGPADLADLADQSRGTRSS